VFPFSYLLRVINGAAVSEAQGECTQMGSRKAAGKPATLETKPGEANDELTTRVAGTRHLHKEAAPKPRRPHSFRERIVNDRAPKQ